MERIVLCHGVFDVLHHGHLYLFQTARNYGNYLVVSIVGDAFVNKGPGRPIFNERERAYMVSALKVVDDIVVTTQAEWWEDHIRTFRPSVYIRGEEGTVEPPECKLVEQFGGRTIFIPKVNYSTTAVLDRIKA
jgi:rfaE bifunctional protein nucleotidyltransferase chain/domain